MREDNVALVVAVSIQDEPTDTVFDVEHDDGSPENAVIYMGPT